MDELTSYLITALGSLVFGGGGVWSYFKSQNNKVEELLLSRIEKLEEEVHEQRHVIKLHESNLLVLIRLNETVLGIARHQYNELPERLQEQLVQAETKVNMILNAINHND